MPFEAEVGRGGGGVGGGGGHALLCPEPRGAVCTRGPFKGLNVEV